MPRRVVLFLFFFRIFSLFRRFFLFCFCAFIVSVHFILFLHIFIFVFNMFFSFPPCFPLSVFRFCNENGLSVRNHFLEVRPVGGEGVGYDCSI